MRSLYSTWSKSSGRAGCSTRRWQQSLACRAQGRALATKTIISRSAEKEASTPLGSFISRQILFSGPIPVSQFMSLCLTHPQHGYYTTRSAVLGSQGDFVTAPEVSQVFGEMIAVWIANVASQMETPDGFSLTELGPGRGTLMNDILRSLRSLEALPAEVNLVEASTILRNAQKEQLAPIASKENIDLSWYPSLKQTPDRTSDFGASALPSIYVAQEFFDALPIHVFQRMSSGRWREQLVDVSRVDSPDETSSPLHFRFVLAPGDTPAAAVYRDRFLPSDGPEIVELCAEGISVAEELSGRVSESGGAALVVDYGNDVDAGTAKPAASLRAISKHKMASVLSQPGLSDVTADVNFSHLRAAVTHENADFRGTVPQQDFMLGLGAAARFRALGLAIVEEASLSDKLVDERLDKLQTDHDRLVGADAMGTIYRAGSIACQGIDTPLLSTN